MGNDGIEVILRNTCRSLYRVETDFCVVNLFGQQQCKYKQTTVETNWVTLASKAFLFGVLQDLQMKYHLFHLLCLWTYLKTKYSKETETHFVGWAASSNSTLWLMHSENSKYLRNAGNQNLRKLLKLICLNGIGQKFWCKSGNAEVLFKLEALCSVVNPFYY